MGMRDSVLNKAELPIELTSLLDVIFIFLLVVILHQQTETRDRLEEMRREVQEAQGEAVVYQDQLAAYQELSTTHPVLTVYADYDEEDLTTRHLRLLTGTGEAEMEELTLTPATAEEGYLKFEALVRELLLSYEGVPVTLSIDREQILYRDEERLDRILKDLTEDYDDLYLR